jgi:phosphoribosylamine--glycine ligase
LKADGLASGKGVFVITDTSQLSPAMDQLFGELNVSKVVAEEMLSGFEVSCIFASNGRQIVPLAPAHDYKRLLDQDKGPNTGGMGSVCPTPRILAEDLRWIGERCAQPIIDAMIKRGAPFKGFLYAGLMIDPNKPYDLGVRVLEYNTRLGDPECQSIMVRLKSDPLDLYEWITGDNNEVPELQWDDRIAACVVIGSDGYPEAPVRGDVISGIELAALVPSTVVFHAGTTIDNRGELVASGGRSLSVVGLGDSVSKARQVAYQAVDMIQLRGRRIRRDIGL